MSRFQRGTPAPKRSGFTQFLCGLFCASRANLERDDVNLAPGIVSLNRRSSGRKSIRRQKSYEPTPLTEAQKLENLKLIEQFKNEENEFEKRDTYSPKITNVPFYQDYNKNVLLVEMRKRKITDESTKIKKPPLPNQDIKRWASEGDNKKKNFQKLPQNSYTPENISNFADEVSGERGIRMRWADMPEVKHLQVKLDKNSSALQEARFEIVTSEASYYKTLRMLINNFYFHQSMIPSTENDPEFFRINPYDKHHLFSNMLNLTTQVEDFLKNLEAEFHTDPMLSRICDIVFEYIEYNSKEYATYIANQDYQSKTFDKLSKDPLFLETLHQLESNPECGGLKFADQLNLPMQRVLRYKLLITAVMHRTPTDDEGYKNGLICLGAVDSFIKNCIDRKVDIQQKENLLELSRKLEFKEDTKSIGLGHRKLIKEGQLRILRLSKQDSSAFKRNFGQVLRKKSATATLLLFNDLLLITKHRQNDKYVVEDICSLKSIRIERGPSPPEFEINSFVIPKAENKSPVENNFRASVREVNNEDKKSSVGERKSSLSRNVSMSKNFRWLSEVEDEQNLDEITGTLNIFPFKLVINVESGQPVEYDFQATSLSERERWIDALDKTTYPAFDDYTLNETAVDAPMMFCIRKAAPKQIDELEVNEGDTVNVLVKCSDGWVKGQVGENRVGWIPENCLEEVTNPQERQKSIKDYYLFNSARTEYQKYRAGRKSDNDYLERFKKTPTTTRQLTNRIKSNY